ncbi:MAG TPA: hypothetical protein VG268_13890 [Streptosporangiaceae bacterium]|nr:hypothetical protein [Streptosporangiaceae bacterium]
MALGLTLGIILGVSGGTQHTSIQQAANANATASPGASGSASPSVTPSASPSALASVPVTTEAANVSCDIIVPANPLTAVGLATPYQLTGTHGASPRASGCSMANFANLGAFVQATILNPWTGQISVYDPLVITAGTKAAVSPVVPTVPRGSVVTIDFGFNGTNLTQVGATRDALRQGDCSDGLGSSIFGQVSFCNGIQFFRAAFWSERLGKLKVPAAGTSSQTGQACPTTRSFTMVDQDQSDNVTSTYLLTGNGQTAQDTPANEATLPGAQKANNGSDNLLLDAFIDPALGCKPFAAPDLSRGGTPGTSQALDELQAAKKSQAAPVALVPENDEMVLVNNKANMWKTDLYRAEVGQPPVTWSNNRADSPANYCQNLVNLQSAFLGANQALLSGAPTPVAGTGDNLFTFLANRLSMSFTNLGCHNYGLTNPVDVTLDGNGTAIAATINTTQQKATNTGGGQAPWPWQRWGRHHHQLMDPSGE